MADHRDDSLLHDGLARLQQTLYETVESKVEVLSAAARQAIDSGGKLLRPKVLLLTHCALSGRDQAEAIALAAIVELLHAASLVHDDINDDSDVRRGHPTVHVELGTSLALITGDFVFVRMLHLLSTTRPETMPRVMNVLANACASIVEGEARDVLRAGDFDVTEAEYFEIIGQKTAMLFAAAAELGAIAAGGSDVVCRALCTYGLELGLAYQIRDDTLDIIAPDSLGKPVGRDLAQGKLSLAPLFALHIGAVSRAGLLPGADRACVARLLRACGAVDYAKRRASEHAARARETLGVVRPSAARDGLADLAGYASQIEFDCQPAVNLPAQATLHS